MSNAISDDEAVEASLPPSAAHLDPSDALGGKRRTSGDVSDTDGLQTGQATSHDGTTISSRVTTPERAEPMPERVKRPIPGLMADFVCPICFDAPSNIVTTPCGHVFCGECLFQVVKRDATKAAGEARARADSMRAMFAPGTGLASLLTLPDGHRDRMMDTMRNNSLARSVREAIHLHGLGPINAGSQLGGMEREVALLSGAAPAIPRTQQERNWVSHPQFTAARTLVQTDAASLEQHMGMLNSYMGSIGAGGGASRAAGGTGGAAGGLGATGTGASTAAPRISANGNRIVSMEDIDPMVGSCPVCRAKISGGFFGGLRKGAVQGLKIKYGRPADALDLLYGEGYTDKLQAWEKRNALSVDDIVKVPSWSAKQDEQKQAKKQAAAAAAALSEKARGKKRAVSPAPQSRSRSASSVVSVIEIDDSQDVSLRQEDEVRPAQRRRMFTEVSDERIDLTGLVSSSDSEPEGPIAVVRRPAARRSDSEPEDPVAFIRRPAAPPLFRGPAAPIPLFGDINEPYDEDADEDFIPGHGGRDEGDDSGSPDSPLNADEDSDEDVLYARNGPRALHLRDDSEEDSILLGLSRAQQMRRTTTNGGASEQDAIQID